MGERLRLTVLEAAEALGVSDDTIRRGLSGTGPLADLLRDAGHRANDGRWIIELTAEAIERHRAPTRRQRLQHTAPDLPPASQAEAEVVRLRERVDALRSAAEAAAAAHREELERLAAGHSGELARLQAAHAAEVGRLRADLDHERTERRAEAERAAAERAKLMDALATAALPWWRRAFSSR
jgi:hypothetical protein